MANTYTTYKDSGVDWIGEIPEHWETRQFKWLFSIKKDIAGKLGYDVLSVTQNGIKIKDLSKNEGQIAQDYSKYQLVNPNDFVMNHMDLLTGYVDCSKYNGVTSPDYRVFHANNEFSICLAYYLHIFQLCYSCKIFYGLGQGVSGFGRWRLPAEQQKLFYLPFPPYTEQQEIALLIDTKCSQIDALISINEKMIDELKAYKQSIITEAVTKGLDRNVKMKDSGVDWIGEIPEHWVSSKLKYYITICSGDALPNENLELEGDFPVYGGGEPIGFYHLSNTNPTDIIVGRVGARCGCVTKPNCLCWATDNALIIKTNEMANDYLYYILIASDLNKLNTSNAQPLITSTSIKNKQIPISPSVKEQTEIAHYLDTKCSEIDSLISIKEKKIEELKDYKKSLIYEYVTGKKRV